MKKKISIIAPIYNEELNIMLMYRRLNEVLMHYKQSYDYEIILVNDGSNDSSWSLIKKLAALDTQIKAITFSRNFGHQMALTAGYDFASGDAIISIDADLQDPPELIHDMIMQWQQGSSIVYARRMNRNDSIAKKFTALVYYRFLDWVSDVKIPRNVGDYRLIDKKVLKSLYSCREKARYLRGMVAWTGFKYSFVDFDRPNRQEGVTGYTWAKMMKLACDGLTGFSLFPLKVAAYVGLFVIITGLLMFSYITFDAVLFSVNYPLFKWLVTIIYIFMGVQFILMWFIGEYIGRIHEQQKNRPLYIVDEVLNCENKEKLYDQIIPNIAGFHEETLNKL